MGVSVPTAVGVIDGNESAVTLTGGGGGVPVEAGGGAWTTAEAGAEAELSGALTASPLLPPHAERHNRTRNARRWRWLMLAGLEDKRAIFFAAMDTGVTKRKRRPDRPK